MDLAKSDSSKFRSESILIIHCFLIGGILSFLGYLFGFFESREPGIIPLTIFHQNKLFGTFIFPYCSIWLFRITKKIWKQIEYEV